MTARELYEAALIELNKIEAPSLLLEDYVYFINKAVQQYQNLVYQKFELDQQSTDDIRVFKSHVTLTPTIPEGDSVMADSLHNHTYSAILPEDYVHLFSCIVEYKIADNSGKNKCNNIGESLFYPAKKLTSEEFSQIINNAYLKPAYKRPYFTFTNVNTSTTIPTNSSMDNEILEHETFSDKINAYTEAGNRLANSSSVRINLIFGNDDTVYKPYKLHIDYLKAPMYIKLTQEQIYSTVDTSQVLEFPDYVCYEVINIFTRLLMENFSDPRLQTNMPINQTIAAPLSQTNTNN